MQLVLLSVELASVDLVRSWVEHTVTAYLFSGQGRCFRIQHQIVLQQVRRHLHDSRIALPHIRHTLMISHLSSLSRLDLL